MKLITIYQCDIAISLLNGLINAQPIILSLITFIIIRRGSCLPPSIILSEITTIEFSLFLNFITLISFSENAHLNNIMMITCLTLFCVAFNCANEILSENLKIPFWGNLLKWKLKKEYAKYIFVELNEIKIPGGRTLTLTRASVKLVHMAISSRVLMSGYRLRLNVCSNSWSCCDVKCVLWRRWRLFFLSFFGSSDVIDSSTFSCFTVVSANRAAVEEN